MKTALLKILIGTSVCWAAFASAANPVPAAPTGYSGAAPGALAAAKARLAAGDAALQPALDRLVADADKALKFVPVSVTQKTRQGPSGDPHDYVSLGPYWWADPSKPDGLPWIRRDGQVNPETRTAASDQRRLDDMEGAVTTLALAYHLTGREPYAAQAARVLRTWFLDPATRMNPHLEYAQGIPGLSHGRPAGLIEAGGVVDAADASGLLAGSPHWSEAEERALQEWCGRFLDWMLTSELGRRERAATNNHGTMYDVRAVRLALKTGRLGLAREILEQVGPKRIAVQIEPDGTQPHELGRTKSFSYSVLNLGGLVQLADYGKQFDVDLWRFATKDGRSIRRAIDYLLPYVADPAKPWPHEQITETNRVDGMGAILRRAANACAEPGYAALAAAAPRASSSRLQFLQPLAPMGPALPADAGGFVSLFNGRDLTGWTIKLRQGDEALGRKVFAVEDGVIHVFRDLPDGYELDTGGNATHGMIYAPKRYRNFIFRFEYKWGAKRLNNFKQFQYDAGCYYHVTDDKIWPVGLEYQVRFNHLENRNHTGDFWSPGKTVIHWTAGPEGSFLPAEQGGVAQTPRRGEHRALATAPFHGLDGEWNRCEVIVMGGAFAIHKLNGVVVNLATDLTPSEGLIGLQSETGEVFYRNIEIKEFAEPRPAAEFLP